MSSVNLACKEKSGSEKSTFSFTGFLKVAVSLNSPAKRKVGEGNFLQAGLPTLKVWEAFFYWSTCLGKPPRLVWGLPDIQILQNLPIFENALKRSPGAALRENPKWQFFEIVESIHIV